MCVVSFPTQFPFEDHQYVFARACVQYFTQRRCIWGLEARGREWVHWCLRELKWVDTLDQTWMFSRDTLIGRFKLRCGTRCSMGERRLASFSLNRQTFSQFVTIHAREMRSRSEMKRAGVLLGASSLRGNAKIARLI